MNFLRPFLSLCLFSIITTQPVQASVTMLGNRIIYPSNSLSMDVKLTNDDNLPYVIQSWFDSGDVKSTPQTGNAPFIVTPPIFKIEPHSGQTARVVFTGEPNFLPQDRESLYYFNFLQIPPTPAKTHTEAKNSNKLLLLLRNRVKVFFRPSQLAKPTKHVEQLGLSIYRQTHKSNYRVHIINNQPWYASIVNINVSQGKQQIHSKEANMIAPFSEGDWEFSNIHLDKNQPTQITISMMNDQGGVVTHEYSVSF